VLKHLKHQLKHDVMVLVHSITKKCISDHQQPCYYMGGH